MRILNRPMFRSGGPINEGVMHGMRNNYQSGQLVRPGPGRPGYQGPDGYWKNLWGAAKKFYGPSGKVGKIIKTAKRVQPTLKKWHGMITPKTTPGITSSGAGQTFLKNLKDFKPPTWVTKYPMKGISKYKQMFKAQPKATAVGTALTGGALTSDPALETYKNIGPISKWVAEAALPGWAERKLLPWKKGPTEAEIENAKLKKELAALNTDKIEVIEEPVVDPNAAAKLAKETQNKRLKSYLDMMGYDSAKKGALSDALIDASALVQDATTEAGSIKHADWGNLINKAIQTTSKRLDKPAQIREAVGLMMTKGAIEKDLTKEKDALQTKALELKIKESEKALDPSAADLALAASGKTGDVTQDMLENIVRSNEGVENFKASFKNKKGSAYYDWLDDNKNASEMKFMKDVVSKESDFSAGFYVFPDRIIEVKDDLTMKWYY